MYSFRKSKKGFTLIELMIVVVIIGILALLGLRLYLTQIEKSNNALVKANAGTIQTTIQANLADQTAAAVMADWQDTDILVASGIHNPMTKLPQLNDPEATGDAAAGEVWVEWVSADALFHINGRNAADDGDVYTTNLVAKY